YMMVSRQIAKEADPLTLQAIGGLMAAPVIVLALVLGADSGPQWLTVKSPDMREALLLLTIGVLGTLSHLLMSWSVRYAPSATLAPIQYLEIPFATFLGWLIFHDLPNGLA